MLSPGVIRLASAAKLPTTSLFPAHGRWIDECLDLSNPNATMFLADLFASWMAWTEREKAFTGTTNAFSRELVRRWGEARKGHGEKGVFFKGVKLR